ncbi:unnamed protein product [Pieris brassicae]|uniref:thioredoxin-dependent peroxiredoxin n=1 Tax=Pieris brassicae TaxID=7116 RepID=A0A9P0TPS9_PIEBR|nr:unnamed protein product [Pieris brassicae]
MKTAVAKKMKEEIGIKEKLLVFAYKILIISLKCNCQCQARETSKRMAQFGCTDAVDASGNVFPGGARKIDHKLQFTKAMISKPAPEWEATAIVNGEITQLKLSSFRGKYLVFFFYPLDFTFVCPTEILAFSERIEEFKKLNTEVVACSVDSHFTHLAWINTPRKEGGLEDLGHTLRGLFIIDDKGVLRQITMNDLPVGRSVDETLRLVQAFQYTDKHGEVCPAGWKPGQDTIIPNPEEKRKYFEKVSHN